jgi:O-antigen ligase
MTAGAVRFAGPGAAALLIAALWPLSAYRAGPLLLPLLLLAAAAAVAIAVRLEAGVVAVLLLAPFTNIAADAGRPIRFIESGLAVMVLAAALLVYRREEARPRGALPWMVVAFLTAGAVSALAAQDPAVSVPRFLGVVAASAVFFAVLMTCRERRQLALVVGGAVASLLLAGLQGVIQKVTGNTSFAGVIIDGEVVGRVAGSFSHPNQFAGFLICLIPLAVAVLLTRSSGSGLRALAAIALAFALASLAFSLTRAAVLGLVLGSLVWVALVRPRLALPLALAVLLTGAFMVPGALRERLSDSAGGDLGLRADLWTAAVDIYSTSPVVGVGLANFSHAYSSLPAQLATGTQRRLLHQSQLLVPPHANNLFLTILAEEGLIGALAFLGLIGAALWNCRRIARRDDPFARVVGLGLGAGLCGMLLQSMFDLTLFGEPSLPLYALLGVATVLATEPE